MTFLLGALISSHQHEYLISPYTIDKNLRSRLQKLVQIWIKCCVYFFYFQKGFSHDLCCFLNQCLTGHMNSIWVFRWKTTILKCSHGKNIISQMPAFIILYCLIGKIYVGFFSQKQKQCLSCGSIFNWEVLKWWLFIYKIQTWPTFKQIQCMGDCVVYINSGYIFCLQRPMCSILQLQLMRLWDLYFQNFLFKILRQTSKPLRF